MSKIELLHGDCYKLIKDIPDKSIDLVYVDIPYLYDKNETKEDNSNQSTLKSRMQNKGDYLKNISDGIDYAILDDLTRIMKHIYIYIYMVF